MRDFVIENGILKSYVGKEVNVVIPNDVTEIGDDAEQFARENKLEFAENK